MRLKLLESDSQIKEEPMSIPLEPAAYILERAQSAKREGLSEGEFFDDWNNRVLAWSEWREASILAALVEIYEAGSWPWQHSLMTKQPAASSAEPHNPLAS
jgi:hypothetical protein